MSDQTLAITTTGERYMPALSIESAVARYNAVVEFTRRVMKSGKDYGVIPGTGDKPTLLKPGAEKLCSLFGMAPGFIIVDKIVDFDKNLFYFQYRCDLTRDGTLIASGLGSCNSREKKYRYRNVTEKKATEDDKVRAIRVETKTGQYGAYKVYVIENNEAADLLNTLDKMAQKRALVAATLIAANASDYFTQDVEDMDYIEGEWHEPAGSNDKQQQPEQAQPKSNGGSNGHANAPAWNPVAALVEAGICENNAAAATLLNKYIPAEFKTPEKLVAWGKLYRGWRDLGKAVEEALKLATEGQTPQ